MAKQRVDTGLAGLIYIVLGQRNEQTGVVPVIAQGKVARPMGENLHLVSFVNPNHMRILENEALMEGLLFENGKQVEEFLKAIQPTPAASPEGLPPEGLPPSPVDNPDIPDGTDESTDGVVDAVVGDGAGEDLSAVSAVATD